MLSCNNCVADLLTLLVVLPILTSASLPARPVPLMTSHGQVTGVRRSIDINKKVDVFYGIPFAQPPLGELRFRRPEPMKPWRGAKDATQKPDSCWQAMDTSFDQFAGVDMWNPNTPMSEDCLYLNVWRPVSRSERPKAIMVWIFGGGFYSGSTSLDIYDGTQLAVQNDVIVVSISYRVGPWGFLYLGTDDAPGNMGLLDQLAALQWVKDNAVNMGGSPDDITLYGESAGAASVGFHLLSPLSRDTFTYAIMESASSLSPWALQENSDAKERAVKLATIFNCSTATNEDMAKCLRNVDPQALSSSQWILPSVYMDATNAPVVDGYFLPDHPINLFEKGEVKNTSILLGVNKNEGIYFNVYGFPEHFPLEGDGQLTKHQFEEILLNIVGHDHHLFEKVKKLYLNNQNVTYTDVIDAVSGDTLFKCPVVDFASMYAQLGNKVYMYSFEHRVSTNPWPEWLGTAHGYEIEIVFGLPLAPGSVYTEEEKILSRQIMDLFTEFAKTGDPNRKSIEVWPEYSPSQEFVVIDTNGFRVEHGLRSSECAFWATASSSQTIDAAVEISIPDRFVLEHDRGFLSQAFGTFSQ